MSKRRVHTPEFKAQVALEAMNSNKTLAEVAAEHGLHPVQVCQWKRQAAKQLPDIFRSLGSKDFDEVEADVQLQLVKLEKANAALIKELEWLKKKLYSYDQLTLRSLLEPGHQVISLRQQCKLLGTTRSSFYYHPRSAADKERESAHHIDQVCTINPSINSRELRDKLYSQKISICKDYLGHLLQQLGFAGFERKLIEQFGDRRPKIQPFLLQAEDSYQSGDEWILDIAYWPSKQSDLFAALVVDGTSQQCLAWGLSDSLSCGLTTEVIKVAIDRHPPPLILHCETFLPYLSPSFLSSLQNKGITPNGPDWLARSKGAGRETRLYAIWRAMKQWAETLRSDQPQAGEEWVIQQASLRHNLAMSANASFGKYLPEMGSEMGQMVANVINDQPTTTVQAFPEIRRFLTPKHTPTAEPKHRSKSLRIKR